MLADMVATEVPEAGPTLGERLGLWLGWTDAIALSAVLGGVAEAVRANVRGLPTPQALAQDLARVSSQLALAFSRDEQLQPPPADPSTNDTVPDFSPYRRCHQAHQAAMDLAVPALRARVRAALARTGADVQLAALDEVMARALAERERQTLASVPRWLELRYRHLRAHHAQPERRFRQDLQDVLRAELELRLQPVQGLLEALTEALADAQATEHTPFS